jgi:phage baseplate assembly protein W
MRERFTSIHYPTAIDSGLGRLTTEDDYARHVEQLMTQLLLTNPGERINRPDFGCGVRRMVFALNSTAAATLAQVTILQALEDWLPSVVQIEKVDVEAADEKMIIKIRYILRALQERRYLNVEVTP